jgi:hypothetical protein
LWIRLSRNGISAVAQPSKGTFMAKLTYFDKNGAFGELDNLIFIDTSQFTEADWFELQCVENVQRSASKIALTRDLVIYSMTYLGRR